MAIKRVVVVFGPGRSGTSLVMQVLRDLGVVVSEKLTEASVANPLGPFEDKEIFDLHASLIQELGGSVTAPMPEGWLYDKATIRALSTLEALMQNRLDGLDGVFGLKDPKISMLIPLWMRVFNKLKLNPAYVLAVRDPGATVASFLMHYNQPASMAELIWLVRMVEALDSTGGDCFIAHYEDWFVDPCQLAECLLDHAELAHQFDCDLSAVLGKVVMPNLNRAERVDYKIQNPYVIKLYAALVECRGAVFDRAPLMSVVRECRQAMEGFKGWHVLAHQASKKLTDSQTTLERVSVEAARAKTLDIRIQVLEREKLRGDQLAVQVEKLQRQLDQLMALGGF